MTIEQPFRPPEEGEASEGAPPDDGDGEAGAGVEPDQRGESGAIEAAAAEADEAEVDAAEADAASAAQADAAPADPTEAELPVEPDAVADTAEAEAEAGTPAAAEAGTAVEPEEPEAPAGLEAPAAAAPPAPPARPVRTVARYIADALAAAGVRLAFTVPGESFLPLLDTLPEAGIRVVAARHEGGASFMAAGAAALTGRPVALLVTRAVGATNMAIGLHTAFADSAPVIALVGQVRRSSRGREAFQEIDLVGSIGRLCRWATEVRDAAALPGAIEEGLRRATTSRPGPVLLGLPEDLLDEDLPAAVREPAAASSLGPPRSPGPDPTTTKRVLHLLLDAERPVILAGAGVLRSRGTADLVKLAELVDVPVVASWRRPDVFPNDHALYLGMTGYFAAPTVRERLAAADAVLVIGCRLNEVASYRWTVPAPGARWAHVDLEPLGVRAGLGAPTIALAADARTFLREARRVLNGSVLDHAGLERRRAANAADREAYLAAREVAGVPWDGPGVHPGRVIATLNSILPPDGIVATDAGHFAGWGSRGLVVRRPGTYIGPTSGAMGYGIPAAVAASLANPGRPVVALAGDGGAGMTFAELETAVRERAHPVVLVFDNARYGTIRDHQDRRGHQPVATDLGAVDWAAAARALGADGIRVDADADVEPALRGALASGRPTVIHLVVDRRWVSVDQPATAGHAGGDAGDGSREPAAGPSDRTPDETPAGVPSEASVESPADGVEAAAGAPEEATDAAPDERAADAAEPEPTEPVEAEGDAPPDAAEDGSIA